MKTRICFITILCALVFSGPVAQAEDNFARIASAHEAGHAGLALLYGDLIKLKSVDIQDHGPENGGLTLTTSHVRVGSDRADVIRRLAQILAGGTAEKLLIGSALPYGSSDDESLAASFARQLLDPEADYRAALAEAQALARKDLSTHRDQLKRLANAILTRKFLTGAEASAIWNQK